MELKEFLPIILSSAVISTFVSTLLSPILEWIKYKLEQSKINNERKYNNETKSKQKLEKIYIDAVHLIQLIRFGFKDRTLQQIKNMPLGSSQIEKKKKELINKRNEINDLIKTVTPLMRIYATDEIYEIFVELITKYGIYSYSNKPITQFLLYSFDRNFKYMCKAIQKDLGLRFDDIKLPNSYTCPHCGYTHDEESDCPNCGICWTDAIDIEDKFVESYNNDEKIQQLIEECMQKALNPINLITYPINIDNWKKEIENFLNNFNYK